jgi:uncharacterized membrane protein
MPFCGCKDNWAPIPENISGIEKNREVEMAKLEKSVTINAPVEKVFSYVGDPQNQLEWLPGITEVRDSESLDLDI